jgi:PD-(D/E)XK nuclease superfamily
VIVPGFDEPTHTYTVNGRAVPSVTTVLKSVRLIDFGAVADATLERARQRGTAVHQILHYLIEGALDQNSVDPALAGYVESAKAWLFDSGFTPIAVEQRLYHPAYHYAGTTDLVGYLNGTPTVADWKTGRAADAAADLQLAAYVGALRENPPEEWAFLPKTTIIQRVSVEVHVDRRATAHLYRGPMDFQHWLQALAVFRQQQKRGLVV